MGFDMFGSTHEGPNLSTTDDLRLTIEKTIEGFRSQSAIVVSHQITSFLRLSRGFLSSAGIALIGGGKTNLRFWFLGSKAAEYLTLGAIPILFGITVLITSCFPVGISQLSDSLTDRDGR
jgi:dolichyl-phosphate-mannose--protein O-mannosyl transferase